MFKKDIPFMKYRWWLFGFSLVLNLFFVGFLFTHGLNFGTDFKGGLNLVYQFQTTTSEAQLSEILNKAGLDHFVVQKFGIDDQKTFVIKGDLHDSKLGQEGKLENMSQPFTQALQAALGADKVSLIKEEYVGPKVGKELMTKGIYAVVWAWVIILIYMAFRFDVYFGIGGIAALIHDVLIALGAFALFGREVNLTVVAAFLTIIGYSINDTIIIFDRVREDMVKHKGMDLVSLVDMSINETLARTIITSLTVFFVVAVLFFRAEGDLQNFAFAMIFGVVTGTYSSVFIACPVFIFLKRHGHRFGLGKKKTAVAST
jgi:protein-export membrane protein, SecD/SecF family